MWPVYRDLMTLLHAVITVHGDVTRVLESRPGRGQWPHCADEKTAQAHGGPCSAGTRWQGLAKPAVPRVRRHRV